MSDNLKAMQECGLLPEGEIPTNPVEMFVDHQELKERLEEYTSRILASQQAAHEAEIARMKGEYDECRADHQKITLDLLDKLRAANAACAMKDEALKAHKAARDYADKYGDDVGAGETCARHWQEVDALVEEAISASQQQVSEWERKQLEPLRAQVAMLRNCICKYGKIDSHYFELSDALENTQATAEQFIAECEQRGAVKALEELLPEIHKARDTGSVWGKVKEKIAELRATSKKAG